MTSFWINSRRQCHTDRGAPPSPHQCPLESAASYFCQFMLTCGCTFRWLVIILAGLPYCPDDCASSWEKCIGNNYGSRACLEYANAGYLCSLRCDGTGFLSKNPLCPGEMRFVSCMRCQPTCSNSHPVECADSSKPCSAGCICPPDRPIWDDALGTCVDSQNCPRGG